MSVPVPIVKTSIFLARQKYCLVSPENLSSAAIVLMDDSIWRLQELSSRFGWLSKQMLSLVLKDIAPLLFGRMMQIHLWLRTQCGRRNCPLRLPYVNRIYILTDSLCLYISSICFEHKFVSSTKSPIPDCHRVSSLFLVGLSKIPPCNGWSLG